MPCRSLGDALIDAPHIAGTSECSREAKCSEPHEQGLAAPSVLPRPKPALAVTLPGAASYQRSAKIRSAVSALIEPSLACAGLNRHAKQAVAP